MVQVLVLLPPIIAIGLALITKEVYSSLFIGVVVGAILFVLSGFLQIPDVEDYFQENSIKYICLLQ